MGRLSLVHFVIPNKYYEVVEIVDVKKSPPIKKFLYEALPIGFPIVSILVVILALIA